MGANAQTKVPTFASAEVLTAANQNLLSNGIPVFSGTATRNDAFGGSGEKTLAEGQFAYLEDSNTTQYYDGAAWQDVRGIANFATAQTNSNQSTTSTTYVDLTTVTSVTVTTGTNAFCVWHAAIVNNTSVANCFVSVAVSGATTVAATDDITNFFQAPGSAQSIWVPFAAGHIFTGLTPGSNTFTLKFKTNTGTASFQARGIQVLAL
jgi:hypothetical protein